MPPRDLLDLGATAVIALALIAWFRSWQMTMLRTQERISACLENHLSQIAAHMARTNAALDLIVHRLLDHLEDRS